MHVTRRILSVLMVLLQRRAKRSKLRWPARAFPARLVNTVGCRSPYCTVTAADRRAQVDLQDDHAGES
ncbi:hypothetical protein ASD00_05400 [Ensifer sp. Root31]|nr:hypothetical protein ASD00_05400 [Ensifer sp. Root31]